MTGVLNACIGAATPGLRILVTVGNASVNYGYNTGTTGEGTYGAIGNDGEFKGVQFYEVKSRSDTPEFHITLAGNNPRSFFSQVIVQKDNGAIQTLRTDDAAYSVTLTPYVGTHWQWSGLPSPVIWSTLSAVRAIYIL